MISLNGFLVGVTATNCIMAGIFFLRFWKQTRDFLFLAFSIAFLIEGANRMAVLNMPEPNEGSPAIYIVRLSSALLILAGILKKNRGASRRA